MTKLAQELAFLRDLYISTHWTERFTNIFDENFKFSKEKQLLYVNAGTGNHALALDKKLKQKSDIYAVCENQELMNIAQAKANIIKANVQFSTTPPAQKFEIVIVDASLTRPNKLNNLIEELAALSTKEFVVFLPTAGSFGEVYSLLWETFFNLDLTDKGVEIERLISVLPTIEQLEESIQSVGFSKVSNFTKIEYFDFETVSDFSNEPLISDILLPAWLDFLSKTEQRKVSGNLVKVIDKEYKKLSFQFSVKATLLRATKE